MHYLIACHLIDRSLAGAHLLPPQEVAGGHRAATCQSSMTAGGISLLDLKVCVCYGKCIAD